MQRWSSDFQGLFFVKIRKMAQGSNDLSTLPLKVYEMGWSTTTRFISFPLRAFWSMILWRKRPERREKMKCTSFPFGMYTKPRAGRPRSAAMPRLVPRQYFCKSSTESYPPRQARTKSYPHIHRKIKKRKNSRHARTLTHTRSDTFAPWPTGQLARMHTYLHSSHTSWKKKLMHHA